MPVQIDKTSLQYLGEEYQYKLVKEFMEDKSCFKDLAPIVDQNMFTGQYLRMFVGTMLEYYNKHGQTPSYSSMAIELRQKSHTQADIEICEAIINKIRNTKSDGSEQTRELATKFFKQQNIIKAANEILRIAGTGDIENYEKCEQMLKDALNTGNHEDFEESRLYDGIEDTLSDDFRITIPTGIDKIDWVLNGGLGKGELGVIVGPSSFGKVQPNDSRIITPYGFKSMGEIKVGDKVIGSDGNAHNVIGVFPHKDWNFYKVTFSDGTCTECGLEHLWNVRHKNEGEYKTMSLKDIIDSIDSKYYIPTTKPVEFNEIEVDIDPYKFAHLLNSEYFKGDISPYNIATIHYDYLYNSLENRIKLLNGLMDNWGYVDEDGNCIFEAGSFDFACDFRDFIYSLGGSGCILYSEVGNKIEFSLPDPSIPVFTVKEKQDKVRYREENKYIVSVEYSRKCNGQCIKVDAWDELYLTDYFIVTHNTSMTTSMALSAATSRTEQNAYNGFKVLQIVFEDRIKQIQRKHFSKITSIEACNLSKEEYVQQVKEILNNYPEKELAQENLRIIRLKSGEKSIDFIIDNVIKKHINNGFRPDLVIIDYFECIKLTGPSTLTKWDKESLIMRKIESAANELNIAFWVPVQGNRDSINTDLVTMDNSGGSIGKIQIAHIIMTITRSLEDIAANKATVAIVKNRAGSSGRVWHDVDFDNGTCTISTDNAYEDGDSVNFSKPIKTEEDEQKEMTRGIFNAIKQNQS